MADIKNPSGALCQALHKNLVFHMVIENEVGLTPYGQLTFNIVLKDGVAQIDTLNIVKNRRRRYLLDKSGRT